MVKKLTAKLTNASFSMVRYRHELERRASKVESSIQNLRRESRGKKRVSLPTQFIKSRRQGLGLLV